MPLVGMYRANGTGAETECKLVHDGSANKKLMDRIELPSGAIESRQKGTERLVSNEAERHGKEHVEINGAR